MNAAADLLVNACELLLENNPPEPNRPDYCRSVSDEDMDRIQEALVACCRAQAYERTRELGRRGLRDLPPPPPAPEPIKFSYGFPSIPPRRVET